MKYFEIVHYEIVHRVALSSFFEVNTRVELLKWEKRLIIQNVRPYRSVQEGHTVQTRLKVW